MSGSLDYHVGCGQLSQRFATGARSNHSLRPSQRMCTASHTCARANRPALDSFRFGTANGRKTSRRAIRPPTRFLASGNVNRGNPRGAKRDHADDDHGSGRAATLLSTSAGSPTWQLQCGVARELARANALGELLVHGGIERWGRLMAAPELPLLDVCSLGFERPKNVSDHPVLGTKNLLENVGASKTVSMDHTPPLGWAVSGVG